jgi:hypothetical protein
MNSSVARVREFRARIRRRSMLVTIEVRNDLPGTFAPMDVRFRGLSGHRADIAQCP